MLSQEGCVGQMATSQIERALKDPSLFFFGELLAIPQIKNLANDPTHKNHYHLLELFAHGTYKDYISDQSKFPSNLSPLILKKIKNVIRRHHGIGE